MAAPDGMQIAAAFHIPIAAAQNTERIIEAIRSTRVRRAAESPFNLILEARP